MLCLIYGANSGKAVAEKKLPATQETYFRGLIVIFGGVFMNQIDSHFGLGHFLKMSV